MDRALWYLAIGTSAQPYFQQAKPFCFAKSPTQRCFHQPTVVPVALLTLKHWGSLGALSVGPHLRLPCAFQCILQHLPWGNICPCAQPHRVPTWGSHGAIQPWCEAGRHHGDIPVSWAGS